MGVLDQLPGGIDIEVELKARPGWQASKHLLARRDILAVRAAWAAQRPLLVRGEPGTGKTQLARAIADRLGWQLICKTINGFTELEELFWRYDAVDRLGEAQAMVGDPAADRKNKLDPLNFVAPGQLWWAFDWSGAQRQYQRCRHNPVHPAQGDATPPPGVVLLIDEIDKADLDLPNGLLEAFGKNGFQNPWSPSGMVERPEEAKLFTVITTNEERELPRAFLRRCLVLQLEYPDEKDKSEFIPWMVDKGRLHHPACSDDVLAQAAEQIRGNRMKSEYGAIRPGLAEYLDLLSVVVELYPGKDRAQVNALKELSQFVSDKQGKLF